MIKEQKKTESAFTINYCSKCAESFFVYLFTYIREKIIIYKYKIDVIENSSHRIHWLKLWFCYFVYYIFFFFLYFLYREWQSHQSWMSYEQFRHVFFCCWLEKWWSLWSNLYHFFFHWDCIHSKIDFAFVSLNKKIKQKPITMCKHKTDAYCHHANARYANESNVNSRE